MPDFVVAYYYVTVFAKRGHNYVSEISVFCFLAMLQEPTSIVEVKMASLGARTNLQIALHDNLSFALRSIFSDSKVKAHYYSASTKAMCMLNGAVAPSLKSD